MRYPGINLIYPGITCEASLGDSGNRRDRSLSERSELPGREIDEGAWLAVLVFSISGLVSRAG